MKLTNQIIEKLQPRDKDYEVCDYDGLYIKVCRTGRKKWLYRTLKNGKNCKRVIGEFPQMNLIQARQARDRLKSEGFNTIVPPTSMTFKEVAEDYMKRIVIPVQVESHVNKQISRLNKHIYPYLGNTLIKNITSNSILSVLRLIEDNKHFATAHKVHDLISQICRYGISIGQITIDPSTHITGALTSVPEKHYPTITNPKEIGVLLRAIESLSNPLVRLAMFFLSYTFVRPGELAQAMWKEIDFEKKQWRIPASKMKEKRLHVVPLSRQAIEILNLTQQFSDCSSYVFYSNRSKSHTIAPNTLNQALKRLGYNEKMCPHGFRAMASTNLNEMGWPVDAIELQLSHSDDNGVRAVYNYAQYMDTRTKMMQAWADWLDEQKGHCCRG